MTRAKQTLAVLGATGSVGVNTLDVVARHPERFDVFALTAMRRADVLEQQCLRWKPRFAVLGEAAAASALQQRLRAQGVNTEVLSGPRALTDIAAHSDVTTVMAAIVGAAGLEACVAAARAGKRLLLANKEALVVGGRLFMEAVRDGGATLLPIDSEHSAIFQCLPEDRSAWAARVDHIVLTASGGPFRTRTPDSLHDVTPDEAVAHPNWIMGRKISVDSATMMNKALEVIEARWLFDLQPEQVRVVIHPQSVIHSMVVCRDHSVLAQLGTPDMRVPIAYGLAFPERIESGASQLDFATMQGLSFEPADRTRFPGLYLAWDALNAPEGSTTVLNAANEVAVAAFLEGAIRFTDIHRINEQTISALLPTAADGATIADLLALDARARASAREIARRLT
jgi:1-deoxy-D-xylulose-5-phosphate reductoisomerase